MRQQKPAAPRLEDLLVHNRAEMPLRVRAAQEEVAVALDIGHRDAFFREAVDGLEELRDGRRFELRVCNEVVKDVAQKRDRFCSSILRFFESLEERPFVPRAPADVAVGEDGSHAQGV